MTAPRICRSVRVKGSDANEKKTVAQAGFAAISQTGGDHLATTPVKIGQDRQRFPCPPANIGRLQFECGRGRPVEADYRAIEPDNDNGNINRVENAGKIEEILEVGCIFAVRSVAVPAFYSHRIDFTRPPAERYRTWLRFRTSSAT